MNEKILFVDDEPNILACFERQLRKRYEIETALGGAEGLTALRARGPFAVVVSDMRMPGMDGIAVLEKLEQVNNAPRVIILTSFEKDEEIYRAIRAGAQGYLLKDSSETEMVAAILAVAAGKRYIPRDIAARLANRMLREDLTTRELQVLELLAQGSTNRQIGHSLNISDNTVRCHVNNIMEKLQVSDRTEAVAYALKKGVLAGTD